MEKLFKAGCEKRGWLGWHDVFFCWLICCDVAKYIPFGMICKDLFRMELKIFNRVAFERIRLGFNKAEMAAIGGVAQPTYLRYENGDRIPDAEFLQAIAAHGADVLYIVTGERSQAVSAKAGLSARKRALLDNYDNLDEEGRRFIESTALFAKKQIGRKTGT